MNIFKKVIDWWKWLPSDKKKKIIFTGIAAAVAVLILVICLSVRGCSNRTAKNNVYTLAKTYADRGEYDRALSLLDSILVKNAEDPVALEMLNQIIEMKKAYNEGREVPQWMNLESLGLGNIKVDIDTDEIARAVAKSLSPMKDVLEESNKHAQENSRSMENLVKMQEEQNKVEKERQALEEKRREQDEKRRIAEEKRLAEEEERRAEQAAQEAQRKAAEEKRKAKEAEIAKKNAELKKQLDTVNDEIQLGKNALATGNIEEAMEHFRKAEKAVPAGSSGADAAFWAEKHSEIAQAYFDAAQQATSKSEKEKLMAKAVEMAKKAISENPKDSVAHYILAQDALSRKDYNTALTELKAAIQNDPNNYMYYYEMGKIQYTQKKYNEAASSFTSACERNGDFEQARYNLGLCQLKLKNDNAALQAFRKAIDINPRYEKAYLEQARILTKRNDFSGAIAAYENVLKLNNINTTATMELGSVYYQAGKLDKAEESFRKALTMLSPSEEQTLTKFNLSTVLFDEGKIVEAEKYAKEACDNKDYIKNDKSKANVLYNYALILDKKGSVDSAIPCYMEVLKYNPDHIKTKLNLGVMYMTLDPPDVDNALKLYIQVYEKDKKNFEVNNNLGSAYLAKEDYSNAILYFQNAIKLDSKNNDVRYNLAKAYAQNKDYDNAKITYIELLKMDQKNWDAYIELAKVCMQLNDNEGAEKYLIYVQEKNPGYKTSEVASLLSSL